MRLLYVYAFRYMRPFWAALELQPQDTLTADSSEFCRGSRRVDEILLDWMLQAFKSSASRQIPFFGYTFITSLTHKSVNFPLSYDAVLADTLRKLKESGLLDNTFLLLLGDHGVRIGSFRFTVTGKLQDRFVAEASNSKLRQVCGLELAFSLLIVLYAAFNLMVSVVFNKLFV